MADINIEWVNTHIGPTDVDSTDDMWQFFINRPEWWPHRACANPKIDPNIFFPGREGMGTAEAKKVCHTCPVMLECREYGMGEEAGVWGGWSGRERETERRRRSREAHNHIAPCGTEAGYQWHRYRNQFACNDCKLAHAKHASQDKASRSQRRWAKRAKGWCGRCADEHHARCSGGTCICHKCANRETA